MLTGGPVQAVLTSALQGILANRTSGEASETSTVILETGNQSRGIKLLASVVRVSITGEDVSTSSLPPGLPLAKSLPQCALQSLTKSLNVTGAFGITSSRFVNMNPYGPASSVNEVLQPMGDVVSLTITDAKGQELSVRDLPQPIVLAVPLSSMGYTQELAEQSMMAGLFLECRFWNETLKVWSTDGCRTSSLGANGTLMCACTHLTAFSAFGLNQPRPPVVDSDVVQLGQMLLWDFLYCPPASALLSGEGLTRLKTGAWASTGSASIFYLYIILIVTMLVLAGALDYRNSEEFQRTWLAITHVRWFDMQSALQRGCLFLRSRRRMKFGFLRFIVEGHVALRLMVSKDTLQILEEAQRELPSLQLQQLANSIERRRFSLVETVVQASSRIDECRVAVLAAFTLEDLPEGDGPAGFTWACAILRRVCKLQLATFIAVHPFTFPIFLDLYTLTIHRVLLLSLQLLGSVWFSALYLHQSGHTLDSESFAVCATDTSIVQVQLAIPVALVSILVSSGVSQLLYQLVNARPRPDDETRRKYLDKSQMSLFYILGLGLCTFYLVFIASFLANISKTSADLWLLSVLCCVVGSTVVMPLIQALMFVPLAMLLLRWDAAARREIFEYQRPLQLVQWLPQQPPPEGNGKMTEVRTIMVKQAVDVLSSSSGPSAGFSANLPGQVGADFDAVLPGP